MAATLVTVAAFDNVLEAGYWQALLEAQGIPVFVSDKEIVAMEWQIARAVGQIKLQVPAPEAGRARAILDEMRRASPLSPPGRSRGVARAQGGVPRHPLPAAPGLLHLAPRAPLPAAPRAARARAAAHARRGARRPLAPARRGGVRLDLITRGGGAGRRGGPRSPAAPAPPALP